jgi:hypothetical protein
LWRAMMSTLLATSALENLNQRARFSNISFVLMHVHVLGLGLAVS